MNAAARAINQSNFFNGQLLQMRISKQLCFLFAILLAVLVSALAIVYTTNEFRMNFIELQRLEQAANQLQLEWGQLLLERASVATPSRVEQMARDKLQMRLPKEKEIFVLRIQ
jgi:cell division protein FtsL